jgi:riboflavin biosynthesis pyrimidine reductase
LGFGEPVVYSNFVASIDGVVSLGGSSTSAGSVISGRYPADRLLMAMLRACASAVLLGAGTLRATPGHRWTPSHVFPDFADRFASLRKSLGLQPEPRLVLLTRSGRVDGSHPALVAGATIVTTPARAKALRPHLPPTCDVIELPGAHGIDMKRVIDELRSHGHRVLLTEGGPHVMGELIQHGLLDEAFLTISPLVAGRDGDDRLGMVAGVELLPRSSDWDRLLSLRRHGDYLFLRYGLRKSARP